MKKTNKIRKEIANLESKIIDKQMEIQEIFTADCYRTENPRIEELEKEIRELYNETQIITSRWDV